MLQVVRRCRLWVSAPFATRLVFKKGWFLVDKNLLSPSCKEGRHWRHNRWNCVYLSLVYLQEFVWPFLKAIFYINFPCSQNNIFEICLGFSGYDIRYVWDMPVICLRYSSEFSKNIPRYVWFRFSSVSIVLLLTYLLSFPWHFEMCNV